MTTTLANLLLGVDMEGGESFCDSVYNFLKNQGKDINLFTNSGFGVWSQSDANKGLATLVYDNLAGGNFAVGDTITGVTSGATGKLQTDNGATSMTLGAVSGTFQDGEQIGNGVGVTADVNGDAGIGINNDPMNNDSIAALWVDDGAGITLAFVAAEYTVSTNAANQRAWMINAALTAGKLYKIELDIKDGAANTQDIEGYFDDGAAQYGKIKVTGVAWASVFWTFECATTTAAGLVGFRIPTSLAASNIQIRRFSCYEITPCCTGNDNKAFDGWHKDTTCDIYRQHWDSTYSKCGSFYSLKIVPTVADDYVRFPGAIYNKEEWYKQFCEQPVTIGAWVYASVVSHAKLVIQQTSGDTSSNYHSGTPGWEWLEVTAVIAANTIFFDIQLFCDATPNVDGTTIVYISQPMLIFGWSLGEGMYQPRLQEVIWQDKYITSNLFDGLLNQSDVAYTVLNIEADSDAMLPKGCRAIVARTIVSDSGSFASTTSYLALRADATIDGFYFNGVAGKVNNAINFMSGWVGLDSNGDMQYRIDASAASAFNITNLRYLVVQVN